MKDETLRNGEIREVEFSHSSTPLACSPDPGSLIPNTISTKELIKRLGRRPLEPGQAWVVRDADDNDKIILLADGTVRITHN